MSKLKISEKELLIKIKQARQMARARKCYDFEDDFAQVVALSFCMGRHSTLKQIWIDLMRKEWGDTANENGRLRNEARINSTHEVSKIESPPMQESLTELSLMLDHLPDNQYWLAEMFALGFSQADLVKRSGMSKQQINRRVESIKKRLIHKRNER